MRVPLITAPDDMQSIDTAPQDGTRITVWRQGYGLYSVQWLDGAWCVRAGRPIPPAEVTHWKALATSEPVPVPPAPLVVSASQAKIALYNAGLLEQVKTLVGEHPYEPVRIWYADANQWERGHVYVQALGAELGLTAEDIDALFQAASLL